MEDFYIPRFALFSHFFFAEDDQLLINSQVGLHKKDNDERDDDIEEPDPIQAEWCDEDY